MSRRTLARCAGLLAFSLAACLTVNVYFYPSKEVDETAKLIIEDIRGMTVPPAEEATPQEENKEDKSSGGWDWTATAWAAEPETTVSSPGILAIKAKLKVRSPSLIPFFRSGAMGEGNNGLVVLRDVSAVSMKDRARLNSLVKEENQDREALYAEIAKELGVKDKDLPKVQQSFAKEWQKTAGSGWWVQKESGEWVKLP